MSKISKAFKAIGLILRRPSLLNLVLDDEGRKRRLVSRKYGMGAGLPVISLPAVARGLELKAEPYAFLDGGCLPTDLALLRILCQRQGVEDYLEIGTWRGESVANVAATGASCVTVNLPDAEMRAMGLSESYIALHRFFSRDLPKVQHVQAHSHTFDFSSLHRKFDLIFVDGDHHTDSIARDTATAFSLLKNERSMIVWHDYALSPETPRFEVLEGILQSCPETERNKLYHVSNTLCALYTREPIDAKALQRDEKPQHWFSLSMKVNP